VDFRILGPLEVCEGDRVLSVGGPRHRALLGLLLLHANEVVPAERLIEDLYGGSPPPTASASLQNSVSKLRKQLGSGVVETRPPGYRLPVGPDDLDLSRFERLVAEAREAPVEKRAAKLREALALWRGPALADLAYEPFAQTEAGRLEELRLAALEERIDADLELARHGELVAELEALVRHHPLRERLRGQLMLALYRTGRQADALQAYANARRTLVDELGLEPGRALQRLEQAILRQEPGLDPPAATQPARREPAARRKTVTVLFSDLVESTTLGERLDPEVLHETLSHYFESMRAVVERHGGTVEKYIGDAIAAVFGVPVAHEDDALRAVRAAVEMRAALDALNEELARTLGLRLRARTGVATGEVFAAGTATGSLAAGDPSNVAARLEEAARPGEILIGEPTLRLVRDAVTVEPTGPLELKGKREAPTAFRLLAVEPRGHGRARRFDTPLVGREAELEALRDEFEASLTDTRCRMVTVLGPAGAGKSRLVREFVQRLGGEARVLRGRCLPYGEGISLWPVIEAVRQAADVTEDTRVEETRARAQALVAGEDAERLIAERLWQLLGVGEGAASSDELAWAVRRLFEALARRRPLVLVLDDVQWGEPAFLDLVEVVTRSAGDVPLLVVGLARPELLDARPEWGSGGAGLRVTPLDDADSTRLVENLLGGTLDSRIQATIGAAAEGNPLYVEELVAMLIDDGVLRRDNGRWVAVGELTSITIPPGIGALLAARLDGLPDDERSALELASVEGQVFHAGAVAELSGEPDRGAVRRALTALVHKDLVRPARGSFAGAEAFRFRHLLIRDAAYAALPKRRRAELHRRFGSWLEERAPPGIFELDAILGYHLEQAYRYGAELGRTDEPLAIAAGTRLAAAGIAAAKRGDDGGVVSLLSRATALLPDERTAADDLWCELGLTLRRIGRLAEGDAALDRAVRAAAGEPASKLRARMERASAALFGDPSGKADEVLELARRAISLYTDAGAGAGRRLGRAWTTEGFVHMFRGHNAAWESAQRQADRHLRLAGWSPSAVPGDIASAAFQGPRPVREVLAACTELIGEFAGHPRSEAMVLCFLGGLKAMLARFDEARNDVARSRALYETLGDRPLLARMCTAMAGQVETLAGDLAAAERTWREGYLLLEELGDVSFLASHAAELADVLYALGRYNEAEELSHISDEHADRDDVYTQVLWRIVRAKAGARLGGRDPAELLAHEAIELASGTDALVIIGRSRLALSEVLRVDARPAEAVAPARAALALFTRKGDVVSARKTRALIRELESEAAATTGRAGR
jgi:class 3 adenylate cyclase